jgi:hypothetical protein
VLQKSLMLSGALLSVAAAAQAQEQPWNRRRPTYVSRVTSCEKPDPAPIVAMDDFISPRDQRIVRVQWWGRLDNERSGYVPFFIAFYHDNGRCGPKLVSGPIYTACVVPDMIQFAGTDCLDTLENPRPIFSISAPLPVPAALLEGGHYWLQISVTDPQRTEREFEWAGHRDSKNCPAVQYPDLRELPPDPCDQRRNDLAFKLVRACICGEVEFGPDEMWLLDPRNEQRLDRILFSADPRTGRFCIPMEREGRFIAEFRTGGAPPVRVLIELRDGTVTEVGNIEFCRGDINGDGEVNALDIEPFLGCMFP